jgi:hypothetical protein
MNTLQNQSSMGFKITIDWQNPTVILKERIFYDNNLHNTYETNTVRKPSVKPVQPR